MGPAPQRLRILALGALALTVAASAAGDAHAGPKKPGKAEKKACVEAHAKGQALAREGKLRAAREEFIACGREICPGAVRKECADFLAEVEESLPSVVIEARDEIGQPTTDVQVFVDGEEVASSLDGRAIVVDPGKRSFRYVSKRGKAIEETVLILEGQRNRTLKAVFGHPPPPPPKPFRIPTLSYALGGVGIGALGNFVFWGLLGRSKQAELVETCAPRCRQEDADTMRRHYLFADLSLGIAALSLGAAVVIAVTENSGAPAAPATVGVALGPGGAAAFGHF